MAPNAVITGWGMYAPSRVMTNDDLARMVDTSDEWIVSRTGIRERRIAADDETTTTPSVLHARGALGRLRPAGRLLRLPVRPGHRQQLHSERHVPPRAGGRGGGAQPVPEL